MSRVAGTTVKQPSSSHPSSAEPSLQLPSMSAANSGGGGGMTAPKAPALPSTHVIAQFTFMNATHQHIQNQLPQGQSTGGNNASLPPQPLPPPLSETPSLLLRVPVAASVRDVTLLAIERFVKQCLDADALSPYDGPTFFPLTAHLEDFVLYAASGDGVLPDWTKPISPPSMLLLRHPAVQFPYSFVVVGYPAGAAFAGLRGARAVPSGDQHVSLVVEAKTHVPLLDDLKALVMRQRQRAAAAAPDANVTNFPSGVAIAGSGSLTKKAPSGTPQAKSIAPAAVSEGSLSTQQGVTSLPAAATDTAPPSLRSWQPLGSTGVSFAAQSTARPAAASSDFPLLGDAVRAHADGLRRALAEPAPSTPLSIKLVTDLSATGGSAHDAPGSTGGGASGAGGALAKTLSGAKLRSRSSASLALMRAAAAASGGADGNGGAAANDGGWGCADRGLLMMWELGLTSYDVARFGTGGRAASCAHLTTDIGLELGDELRECRRRENITIRRRSHAEGELRSRSSCDDRMEELQREKEEQVRLDEERRSKTSLDVARQRDVYLREQAMRQQLQAEAVQRASIATAELQRRSETQQSALFDLVDSRMALKERMRLETLKRTVVERGPMCAALRAGLQTAQATNAETIIRQRALLDKVVSSLDQSVEAAQARDKAMVERAMAKRLIGKSAQEEGSFVKNQELAKAAAKQQRKQRWVEERDTVNALTASSFAKSGS